LCHNTTPPDTALLVRWFKPKPNTSAGTFTILTYQSSELLEAYLWNTWGQGDNSTEQTSEKLFPAVFLSMTETLKCVYFKRDRTHCYPVTTYRLYQNIRYFFLNSSSENWRSTYNCVYACSVSEFSRTQKTEVNLTLYAGSSYIQINMVHSFQNTSSYLSALGYFTSCSAMNYTDNLPRSAKSLICKHPEILCYVLQNITKISWQGQPSHLFVSTQIFHVIITFITNKCTLFIL
jgi:hypothetical protein